MAYVNHFGNLTSARAGARVIAWFIDIIIIGIILFVANIYIGDWITENIFDLVEPTLENLGQLIMFILFFAFVIGFLYFFILEAARGQTIGKILFDIKTLNAGGKRKISIGRAALRALYKCTLGMIGIAQIVDFAMIYSDERSLGDRICGTIVVQGDSWRAQQYAKTGKKRSVASIASYDICPDCGGQVPLYTDGTGKCPKCGKILK